MVGAQESQRGAEAGRSRGKGRLVPLSVSAGTALAALATCAAYFGLTRNVFDDANGAAPEQVERETSGGGGSDDVRVRLRRHRAAVLRRIDALERTQAQLAEGAYPTKGADQAAELRRRLEARLASIDAELRALDEAER